VLGYGKVGIHDDFFDIGGHSLLVTQIISRIRRAMGIELTMRHFFEMPTLARQAEYVEAVLRVRTVTAPADAGGTEREEIEI
jgi:acyl carrier protein